MKQAWKWTVAILAALAVMIAAGMAGAENTIALNNPQTVNITIPGDIILYEYTPQVSGVYRFYAYSEETEDWPDTYGYLLDEDEDLLDSDDDGGEGGHFQIIDTLEAGTTYTFCAGMYSDEVGTFHILLEKLNGVYAKAYENPVLVNKGEEGTIQVLVQPESSQVTYQWYEGDQIITGATGATYHCPAVNQNKDYRCVITDGQGNTQTIPVEVIIDCDVRPVDPTKEHNEIEISSGDDVSLTANVTAAYGADQLTYEWFEEVSTGINGDDSISLEQTGSTLNLENVTRNREIVCVITDANGNESEITFSISIPSEITVTIPDDPDEFTPAMGGSVPMEVSVTSDYPVTYQWYRTNNIGEYDQWRWLEPISGATGAKYTATNVRERWYYLVLITDSVGNYRTHEFRINPQGTFSAGTEEGNSEADIELEAGETATLKVIATSSYGTLSYQWYRYNYGVERYLPIHGATGSTLQASATYGDYRCTVRDPAGNRKNVYFYVTVNSGFTAAANGDTELNVTPGSQVTIGVNATSSGTLKYKWLKRVYNVENGYEEAAVKIPGATSSSITITANERARFICRVSDSFGNSESIMFVVTLENGFSVQSDTPVDLLVKPGDSFTLSVNGTCSNGTIVYKWSVNRSYGGGHESLMNTGNSLTIAEAGRNDFGRYTVYAHDSYGNSESYTFNVMPDNEFSVERDGDDEYLHTAAPNDSVTLKVNASCISGTLKYQWYESESYISNGYEYINYKMIQNATGASYTIAATHSGWYRCSVWDEYDNGDYIEFYVYIDNQFSMNPKDDNYNPLVPYNEDAVLEVTATCTTGTVTYQWYHIIEETDGNGYSSERRVEIDGATNATLPIKIEKPETYFCRGTDTFGNTGTVWFHVGIDNQLTAEAAGEQYLYCSYGESITMTVNASCKTGELTYQWIRTDYTLDDAGQISAEEPYTIPDATGKTYQVTADHRTEYACYVTDVYGNSKEVYFDVQINNHLTAGYENPTVLYGETATLNVTASCDYGSITYQWGKYIRQDEYNGYYQEIEGVTGKSYTTEAINEWTKYRCIVHDVFGNRVYLELELNPSSGLTAEAEGDTYRNFPSGQTTTMKVNATCVSDEISYQWYQQVYQLEDNRWIWKDVMIDGADTATYVTGKTGTYFCRVTDEHEKEENIFFYVTAENMMEAYYPDDNKLWADSGKTATMRLNASCLRGGLTFQWYRISHTTNEYDEDILLYTLLPSATGNTCTTEPVTGKAEYTCYFYDEYGNYSTAPFTINIDNHLSAERIGEENRTVRMGESEVLAVEASCDAGTVTYQWYKGSEQIEGATNASYTVTDTTSYYTYSCQVTDQYGKDEYVSFSVYIDSGLTAEPDGKQFFTKGNEPITLAVKASNLEGDQAEYTYRWTRYNDEIPGETGSTLTLSDPETSEYACEVNDGFNCEYVYFYITEGAFATAMGPNNIYARRPGEEITLRVAAWNAAGDISYEWYEEGNETHIWNETEAEYTFTPTGRKNFYCRVTGTGLSEDVYFYTGIDNYMSWEEPYLSVVNLIPEGGSVELKVNLTSQYDKNLICSWRKDNEVIPGATTNTLTVTSAGYYSIRVEDHYGNAQERGVYCVAGTPGTISPGATATGTNEDGKTIYQIQPAVTGSYEIEAGEWAMITLAGSNNLDYYSGKDYVRFEQGKTYYILLDMGGIFKYTLNRAEQEEYTITLQKGQQLEIPYIYSDEEYLYPSRVISDNSSVVRTNWYTMEMLETGTANVTVLYQNYGQRVFHITVVDTASMKLPEQLTRIEQDAFQGDTGIRFIELGNNVQYVESGAFAGTGNINIIVHNYYTEIQNGAFANTNPVVICIQYSNAEYYCRKHGIPYFWLR